MQPRISLSSAKSLSLIIVLQLTVCIADVRIFDAGSAGTTAKLKNKRTKNEQMLTDVRLPGQLIVSDQMLIASPSCPYFGNTFVICRLVDSTGFQFPFPWSNMPNRVGT